MNLRKQEDIHVTFITKERVCVSLRVSPESPHTVNSLSNMSAIVRSFTTSTKTGQWDGGCHVIIKRWLIGTELLAGVSAHAPRTTPVQTRNVIVTVIRMTLNGVKTAVSSPTKLIFQLNSWGLEIQVLTKAKMNSATIPWGSSSAIRLLTDK